MEKPEGGDLMKKERKDLIEEIGDLASHYELNYSG